ncbi:MAG: type II toxin-antitoxin system HicA family toxin [Candidatus Zapsychrus exili]|nr:type II toxin-antitoxin system HicA family toxin [Candidatus Zapsychrus exili]
MTKKEKLFERFKKKPKDFTWDELCTILSNFGFSEYKTGKTGGSRRRFVHDELTPIVLHKPHPGKILKKYQIELILERLKQEKLL